MDNTRLNLIPESVSPATHEAFAPYAWCVRLLKSPAYVPVQTVHQNNSQHIPSRFMSSTLRDNDSIIAVQSLYRQEGENTKTPNSIQSMRTDELTTLYLLGEGVSGHTGISHGGLIATLLDQQAGSIVIADPTMPRAHTVFCNIRYHRPVPVPGPIQLRAWKARVEGRKYWVNAELLDGENVVLATAETMFINAGGRL